MNLLLDTNALLWWLDANPRLRRSARQAIEDSTLTYVSAVSVWEIGIKVALGKLEFRGDIVQQLALNRFTPLSVTVAHAIAAGRLPLHHRDPFDRMLVAQASVASLTLVTSDPVLKKYAVPMILAI